MGRGSANVRFGIGTLASRLRIRIRCLDNQPTIGRTTMLHRLKPKLLLCGTMIALAACVAASAQAQAPSGEPIRIGYSMALTGGLAPNGKSALLAHKIWEE